jgi:hypothetical protein
MCEENVICQVNPSCVFGPSLETSTEPSASSKDSIDACIDAEDKFAATISFFFPYIGVLVVVLPAKLGENKTELPVIEVTVKC